MVVVSYNGSHLLEDLEPPKGREIPNYASQAWEAAKAVRKGKYDHIQAKICIVGSGDAA